jgi:protein SCO1/2
VKEVTRTIVLLGLLAGLAACSRHAPAKQYTVVGQIVALAPDQKKVTIKHQDIVGFMPAMTMTYEVPDAALLASRTPGDLIRATLAVSDTDARITSIDTTGHAPLDAPPPTPAPIVLQVGQPVADAQFLDQAGRPRALADFRGHRVALTFIYTRCPVPNFCPLMSRNFATVQTAIRQRADLADVRLVSVTLDPAYDRPPVLAAHARLFDADPAIWTFLTGAPGDMQSFASQFGIYSEADAENPPQLIHSLQTAVIGPDGRLVHNTRGNEWTPSDILAQLATTAAPGH